MPIENSSSKPVSSLWYAWYLLSDLDGQIKQVRRGTQVLIGTGLGLDSWSRRVMAIEQGLGSAIRHAQDAGIDTAAICPDLLPLRPLPWPATGLHLWWTTREALAEADRVTRALRSRVARELKGRVGDSGPRASWFAEGEGSGSSRLRRGSVNPRSSGSRVIAAG